MIPLNIVFRHFSPEEEFDVEISIYKKARNLNCFKDHITACRVIFDAPHDHDKNGHPYAIRILLFVSGKMIAVGHDPEKVIARKRPDAAVGHAFDIAHKKVKAFIDKQKRSKEQWRRFNMENNFL